VAANESVRIIPNKETKDRGKKVNRKREPLIREERKKGEKPGFRCLTELEDQTPPKLRRRNINEVKATASKTWRAHFGKKTPGEIKSQ